MTSFNKLLTGLALVVAVGSVSAAPVFVEVATGMSDLNFETDSLSSGVYSNISFKINDRYSLTPELYWTVDYNSKVFTHKYLRFVVSDKNLAKLGDWQLGVAYRWTAPTTTAAQAAGTYGTFMYRPQISGKVGPLPTTVRLPLSLPLNRNGYQVNPTGATSKGNPVFGGGLEILPGVDLGDSPWDLGFVIGVYPTLTHADKGADNGAWSYATDFEVESGYNFKSVKDLRIALNVTTSAGGSSLGDAFKVCKKDNTSISILVDKAF